MISKKNPLAPTFNKKLRGAHFYFECFVLRGPKSSRTVWYLIWSALMWTFDSSENFCSAEIFQPTGVRRKRHTKLYIWAKFGQMYNSGSFFASFPYFAGARFFHAVFLYDKLVPCFVRKRPPFVLHAPIVPVPSIVPRHVFSEMTQIWLWIPQSPDREPLCPAGVRFS